MGTTNLSPMFGHFEKRLWQKRMAKVDAFQGASCICWYHSSAALKFWVLHAIDQGQLQIIFMKEDALQFDGAHRLFLIFGPAVTLDTRRILGIPQSKVSIFNRKLNAPQLKISNCEICFGNICSIMELKKASPGPTQTPSQQPWLPLLLLSLRFSQSVKHQLGKVKVDSSLQS